MKKTFLALSVCAALSAGAAQAAPRCYGSLASIADCYIPLPAKYGKTSSFLAPMMANQVRGRSVAEVHAAFPATILGNLAAAADANVALGKLTDRELALLSVRYVSDKGNVNAFLAFAAQRLNPTQLRRVAGVFGAAPVSVFVGHLSGFGIQSIYFTMPTPIPVAGSVASIHAMGLTVAQAAPAPSIDMTIGEIYLEYRTATVGSLTVEAALASTAMFAGRMLSESAGAGWVAGTIIRDLAEWIKPGISADVIELIVKGVTEAQAAILAGVKDIITAPAGLATPPSGGFVNVGVYGGSGGVWVPTIEEPVMKW